MIHRTMPALALCALLATATPARALEANSASRAELEQLPGLGPAKVDRLLKERDRGAFESWQDLARRVPGFGAKTSSALSREGLTVNRKAFLSTERPVVVHRPAPSPP